MMADINLKQNKNMQPVDLWDSWLSSDSVLQKADSSISIEADNSELTIGLWMAEQLEEKTMEQVIPDLSWVTITEDSVTEQSQSIEWGLNSNLEWVTFDEWISTEDQTDNSIFLWESGSTNVKMAEDEWYKIGKYLRLLIVSLVITVLSIIVIVCFASFNKYILIASKPVIENEDKEFVNKFKNGFKAVKWIIWKDNTSKYPSPDIKSLKLNWDINTIINTDDLDYIEKKDLLTNTATNLVKTVESNSTKIDKIKQDIAKQWFFPVELENILSEDDAISTIQRSLNALEVIKFSTAANVFSYMNTALSNIAEMVRMGGVSIDQISQLLMTVASRWEKDVAAYVYLCYLNPFETSANCDTINDLNKYYKDIIKDDTLDLDLFKNVMNAIDQLLENADSAMFAITFNGFNAQSKDITFNIEVYTNQNDERVLIAQGKRNPNIFILTNIINLLKQSSFIIWADIDTKTISVDTREVTLWWISNIVNYSSQDFTVPIQKDTEREIFDYIDLDKVEKLANNIKLQKWEK